MTASITIDGTDRSAVVPFDELEVAESAYLGEVGDGSLIIEDTTGLISVPGHKQVVISESTASPSRVWTGYVGNKTFTRGDTSVSSNGRYIQVALHDVNALLARRVFNDTDAKRPKETISTRMTWLLGSDEVRGAGGTGGVLFADYGAVSSSTVKLDKTDYRGQTPGDVLAAMAKAARFNYHLRWSSSAGAVELVFRDDNTSTADTSTASISNAGDADGVTIFEPLRDATLEQDPDDVYSGAYATHARGRIYETRPATASNFAWRDGVTEDAGTRNAETASRDARSFLYDSRDEDQTATLTLELRHHQVNLFRAGQRVSTRLTHLAPEGWNPARYARILRRRIKRPLTPVDHYEVTLDLSPQEDAPATCSANETASTILYPLGGPYFGCDGVPKTRRPNPTGGNVYYLRPGVPYPVTVKPDYCNMVWHFATYGAGGIGTSDFFASGFQNELRFVLVGNGTLTIKTEKWQGQSQPYTVFVEKMKGGVTAVLQQFTTGTAGDSTSVTITSASQPDCTHLVRLRADARLDGSYIGMGWSSAIWTLS